MAEAMQAQKQPRLNSKPWNKQEQHKNPKNGLMAEAKIAQKWDFISLKIMQTRWKMQGTMRKHKNNSFKAKEPPQTPKPP